MHFDHTVVHVGHTVVQVGSTVVQVGPIGKVGPTGKVYPNVVNVDQLLCRYAALLSWLAPLLWR